MPFFEVPLWFIWTHYNVRVIFIKNWIEKREISSLMSDKIMKSNMIAHAITWADKHIILDPVLPNVRLVAPSADRMTTIPDHIWSLGSVLKGRCR